MPFDQTKQDPERDERLPSENLAIAYAVLKQGLWCKHSWYEFESSPEARKLGCASEVLHEAIFGVSWCRATDEMGQHKLEVYRKKVCERPEFQIVNDLLPDWAKSTNDDLGDSISGIIRFNDHPNTGLREVLAVFGDAVRISRILEQDALQLAKARGLA